MIVNYRTQPASLPNSAGQLPRSQHQRGSGAFSRSGGGDGGLSANSLDFLRAQAEANYMSVPEYLSFVNSALQSAGNGVRELSQPSRGSVVDFDPASVRGRWAGKPRDNSQAAVGNEIPKAGFAPLPSRGSTVSLSIDHPARAAAGAEMPRSNSFPSSASGGLVTIGSAPGKGRK